ncbi:MAG: aquaporin [Chloroflexi bacterium]|nr:aquaporin [Chloroflexota bacterium]
MAGVMKPSVAELMGTFALTLIGGAVIANGQAGLVGVAFAHGVTLMVMIYVLGGISGAHVNPAVTLGLALGKKIRWLIAALYWIAQFVGASIAGFVLLIIFPDPSAKTGFLGTPTLASTGSPFTGIFIKVIFTFFLVLVVFLRFQTFRFRELARWAVIHTHSSAVQQFTQRKE